jgi:glyoxylase-like metal-dependent hydrolase (beta-lactamase superfamily II)
MNYPAADTVDTARGLVLRRVVVGPLATNCWVVHGLDAHSAVLVDPGDEPERVLAACDGLDIAAVVLTHAHWDHVLAVPAVIDALSVPVLAHPADAAVWPGELRRLAARGHWDAGTADVRTAPAQRQRPWDGQTTPIQDGHELDLGDLTLTVLHTPGHTPGGLVLAAPGHLLTGDTLFPGGPGLTGTAWPESDFPSILRSVERLLDKPDDTRVHPGHGPSTTIGTERPQLPCWRARGW